MSRPPSSLSVPPAPAGGVIALFFIQMFSTLGFAVLSSTLVLYATKRLGFSEPSATAMMGVFAAFNFGLHLFGGYLGGRFLSNRNLFVLGMVLQVVGCYLIAVMGVPGLYWGSAMFLTGSGLNVTCLNMMLTQRFTSEDDRREGAFLWNYAAMNVGFFLGFTLAGYYQLANDYHSLFLLASVGNLIAIILALLGWRVLADISTPLKTRRGQAFFSRMLIGVVILAVLVPLIRLLLAHTELTNSSVIGIGALILIWMIITTLRHPHHAEKKRMAAYLILTCGSLGFFSLYQLAPMGLTLFAEHNIDRNVWGWVVAPQWIQNINTFVIAIGGPLLAWGFNRLRQRGYRIDVPLQFAASLLCMGLGMLVLPIGIALVGANGLVAFKWIALSYLLQAISELLISPIGYAMIGRLAPARYQGVMMGCWMMVNGVAAVLASYISGWMPQNIGSTPVATNPGFSSVFSQVGWGAMIIGIVLFLLIPLLRKLIKVENQPETALAIGQAD